MALVVPPPAMIVHSSFNLLYQFWIHTEVIGDLGPLEYILNTSNHHRVHHGNWAVRAYMPKFIVQRAVSYQSVLTTAGSNRYCLDKNYAGVLIIWDRLFGTFENFRPEEKITYGLVGQPQFFNPLRHQVRPFYSIHLIWKLASPTQMNSFSAVLHEICFWESLQHGQLSWQGVVFPERPWLVPRNWKVRRSSNGPRGNFFNTRKAKKNISV